MDDYELENALAWDDGIGNETTAESDPQERWTTVQSSKRKGKQAQRDPPPPRRQPRPQEPSKGVGSTQGDASTAYPSLAGRAWRLTPRKCQAQPRKAHEKLSRLSVEAIGEAQQSWRHWEPATDKVCIPTSLVPPDRHAYDAPYIRIARANGAFLYCETPSTDFGFLTFHIWGELPNATATRLKVQDWIRPASKVPVSSKMGKVISLTETQRQHEEKRWRKDIDRHRYRRFPPLNMPFGAIGSFHWPVDECRPEECFGMSYQAFDPIRMEYKCYIDFESDKSLFQVFGSAKAVRAALMRIRQAYFQIAARRIIPARAYLLRYPDSAKISSHVYLVEYVEPDLRSSSFCDNVKSSLSPRGKGCQEDGVIIQKMMDKAELSIERVKVTLANALQKLHYYKGHLKLRVRLGRFLVQCYERPPSSGLYKLQEYEDMIEQSQFRGRVTGEIGDQEQENGLLSVCLKASTLLCPQDAITEGLHGVQPIYSAVFIFDDETKGDLRLSLTWLHPGEADFSSQPHTIEWTRLDRNTNAPTRLVDLSLTDLRTSSAWHFELSAAQPEDPSKLPPQYRDFAEHVHINKPAALAPSFPRPFVAYNPAPPPKSLRQARIYRFALLGTDYTLELAQVSDRAPVRPRERTPAPPSPLPRWSLAVFRVQWDTWFDRNAGLPVGMPADWEDDLDEWFPPDSAGFGTDGVEGEERGKGFAQFWEHLARVEELVRNAGRGGAD